MKAIALKVKNYSSNVHIVNNNIQRSLLNFLLASLSGLMVLYTLFLCIMVFNIVERKATEAEIRTVSNDVSGMELSYLELSNKIDLNFSHSLGFKETNTKFATRKSLGTIKIVNNDI
jgi:hypothetical protein